MTDLDRVLSDSLKSVGDAYSPRDAFSARREFLQRRHRHRVLSGILSVGFVGALAVLGFVVVQALPVSDRPPADPTPAGAPQLAVTATIPVGEEPTSVAVGYGSAWVTNSGSDTVTRVDVPSNEVVATIAIPPSAGAPDEIVTSDDGIYVSSTTGSVVGIDPATDEVRAREQLVSGAENVQMDIAVAGEALWATGGPSLEVTRLTLAQGARASIARTRPLDVGSLTDVSVSGDEVWGLDAASGRLAPLAASPGEDVPRVPHLPTSNNADLAVGFGALWVATGENGTVIRIDLRTGELEEAWVGGDHTDLATGLEAVWAVTADRERDGGTLMQLDPGTGEIVGPRLDLEGHPVDVAADEGAVWVVDNVQDTLTRIEEAAGTE